ncbi:SHOCT domain-containing protein [Halobacteria archaeon HArc-gm2]|nr:SHOCT domain-containing protein [Halobacteria archaeon HArc-gm2]
MGRLFPMERSRLLGWLIVATFALGVLAGFVAGVPRLMGGVFFVGYFLVVPLVAVLGDSLAIVADSEEASIWRRTGREFSKGRNLTADEQVDPEPTDPVEELRAAYVSGDIDEAEFEHQLERLLAEQDDAGTGEEERSLDVE